jgi:hypothetical protein
VKNLLGGAYMSKAEPASYDCPICGWTLKSPFGKEDLEACVACHNEKHHNKSLRMSRADLMEKIAKPTIVKK